jgi:hypothetical protein
VQSPAVQTFVQPSLPQQQYYHIVENAKPEALHITQEPLQTVYHAPQAAVASYQANTPIQTGVVYSAPLTSATTTVINPQPHALGSNGYSTYTIRTSKGTSTSDVLY